MTREEAVRRIDQAAEEKLAQLDWAGLGLEELQREIGKFPPLERLVLGNFAMIVWAIALLYIL